MFLRFFRAGQTYTTDMRRDHGLAPAVVSWPDPEKPQKPQKPVFHKAFFIFAHRGLILSNVYHPKSILLVLLLIVCPTLKNRKNLKNQFYMPFFIFAHRGLLPSSYLLFSYHILFLCVGYEQNKAMHRKAKQRKEKQRKAKQSNVVCRSVCQCPILKPQQLAGFGWRARFAPSAPPRLALPIFSSPIIYYFGV